MKRILRILLPLMLFLACVPTPESEVVLNKTEGRLEAAITETAPVPAYVTEQIEAQLNGTEQNAPEKNDPQPIEEPTGTLRSSLGAPKHCTDSAEGKVYGGMLEIEIDADIEIPNVSAVPVFLIQIKAFTPEEKAKIAKVLLGEGPYYERNRERTKKERLKANIDRLALILSKIDARAYGEDYPYDEMRAVNNEELQKCLERYAEMPEPEPMEPWKGSFQDEDICLANSENYWIKIQSGQICYYDPLLSDWSVGALCIPRNNEEDHQAIETAGALFGDLTTEPYIPYGILRNSEMLGPERMNDKKQYLVELSRTYAGIPCYAYTTDHGSDTAMQSAGVDLYSERVFPESIEINVQDGKVITLDWSNAIEVINTENENVALLPFPEILEIFKRQIFRSIYLDSNSGGDPNDLHMMKVTRICFSYMRVKKQDGNGEYYLLPVWDFMCAVNNPGLDGRFEEQEWLSQRSILTINAIDGSIIDRNIGY